MADSINIGNITVDKFYLGGSSDVKIYLGTTKLYPHLQEPCFAVVDNISTYTARTYVDVYETSNDKWYKLNNLSAYEEYGIYGSGRTITYYEGKLTIDGDYEYQYSGSGWNNVGEVSGSSRVPDGYSEVEYIESNGTQYINTNAYITNTANFEVGYTISGKSHQWGYVHQNVANGAWAAVDENRAYFGRWNSSYWVDISNQITTGNNTIVYKSNSGITVNETFNAKTLSLTSTDNITTIPLHIFGWWDFYKGGVEMQQITQRYKSFYLKVNGVLIRDFVPCKRDSDSVYGLYDLISDSFLTSPNGNNFVGGSVATGTTIYPIYYNEIQDPPNNVTFTSMTEAEDYQCPWIGMHATIAGDNYIFSGDSQSGYEWVYQPPRIPTAYTEVEYVENTGNSSVNLGVYLSSSVGNTFEITLTNTMSYTSGLGEYQTILTCMSEAGEPYGGFAYRLYNSESSRQCFLNPTTRQTFSSTTVDSKFEVVISCSGILNGYTHDYPLNLFSGLDSSKIPFRFCKGKVYSLQVTINDVLTRDLVPCQRKSDGVYGLYDVVGGVFYTSVTSTPLIGGSPV